MQYDKNNNPILTIAFKTTYVEYLFNITTFKHIRYITLTQH